MGNYNRDDRRGGGGRSFGGSNRSDDRNGGRPSMHRAICSECGNSCEVPFKPTGSKPVFCSQCFEKQGGGNSRPSYGGDRNDRDDRRERPSYGADKQMFKAVCSKCNEDCEVPFRPTSSKPVYCSNCFEKGGNTKGGVQSSEELKTINVKLDMIMTSLGLSVEKKEKVKKEKKVKKVEEVKEVPLFGVEEKEEKTEKKKTSTKKPAVKKVVKKKLSAKKKVKKVIKTKAKVKAKKKVANKKK